MPKMTKIRPVEVSLVDRPANKWQFLTLKSQGEPTMDEILQLIEKTEADNEEELVDALDEAGYSDDVIKAATVMARVTNGMRDEIGSEEFLQIGKSLGFEFEIVNDEAEAEPEQDENAPINKSELPEDAQEYLSELEHRLEKMEESAQMDGFIEKARENYPNLTASAEEIGALLKDAHETLQDENRELLERLLKSSNERLGDEGAELEKEAGTSEETSGDAEADFFAKRDEILESSDEEITKEAATLKTAREHPELYAEYKRQQNQ